MLIEGLMLAAGIGAGGLATYWATRRPGAQARRAVASALTQRPPASSDFVEPGVFGLRVVGSGRAKTLVLGDAEAPIVSLRMADRASHRAEHQAIVLPAECRHALQPLLAQAPRALVAAADFASSHHRVRIIYSAATQAGLDSGVIRHMPSRTMPGAVRGSAVNPTTGHPVEGANIVKGVNGVAVAAALWQVAAMVTAQKFLADIDAKLSRISDQLDELQEWHKNEVVGRLAAGVRRVREIGESVQELRLDVSEAHILAAEVEAIDRESQNVTEQMAQELHGQRAKVQRLDWRSGMLTNDEAMSDARRIASKSAFRSSAYLTSVHLRLLCNVLRPALGLSAELALRRLEAVDADLMRHAELGADLVAEVKRRSQRMEAAYNPLADDSGDRARVRKRMTRAWNPQFEQRELLAEDAARARAALVAHIAAANAPQEIEVEIDRAGNIRTAHRRLPA